MEQNAQRGVTVRYTPQHQAARAAEQTAAIPEYLHAGKGRLQGEKTGKIDPRQDSVQRLVDIEQKMAEGKGKGYERWAKIHNLKQAAKTLTIYQQYGFSSPEQLEAAVATAYQEMRQTSGELKALETKLQGKRELRQQVLAYAKTKPIREGLKAQKSEKARAAYRQANESDFIIAEAARPVFQGTGAYQAARPKKRCRPRSSSLSPRKTACTTPITNRSSGSGSCRPSSGTSTRFCAGKSRTAERSRAMNDKPSRMDYRQHQAARRLVHECCNYDEGNCLLLDDGEPCVCVQSISYSLMCRWFRVAVLPLDGELAAALLYRGSRKRCAVCGAAFVPKSNRGKYCPGCAGCMKKRKAAERKRKQRQKCHALEPFKPA